MRSLGRATEAKGSYERAIALKEPWVREDPTNTEHRYVLICSLRRPAGAARPRRPRRRGHQYQAMLGSCEGSLPRSAWEIFETEIACCHAAHAGLAGRAGSGVTAAEGESEAARAMEWLGRAVANGFRNANLLRIESALDPLRERSDFKKLVAELLKDIPPHQEKE